MAIDPQELDRLRRQSGLRIDALGRWHFRGQLVENDRVQRMFHQNLRWDPDTGALTLHIGAQWAYVEVVDDVGYFVGHFEREDAILLSGERVPLTALAFEAGQVDEIYALLPDGRRARLLRRAAQDLEPYLDVRDGRVVVIAGGHESVVRSAP